jgi:hypothetical protein
MTSYFCETQVVIEGGVEFYDISTIQEQSQGTLTLMLAYAANGGAVTRPTVTGHKGAACSGR